MRHLKHTGRLGLPYNKRKALLRVLVEALLTREKIRTTETRAAEARRHAEKMITLARDGSRRRAGAPSPSFSTRKSSISSSRR